MFQAVSFDPVLPLPVIIALAALALVTLALALWRGLVGWWLRALAALVLLFALAGPSLRREDRAPVPNIAIVVLDDSASNALGDRHAQLSAALDGLRAELRRVNEIAPLEVREIHVTDKGTDGTHLLTALSTEMAELPADRIAGAILVTDGQIHDPEALKAFPAPVQVLLTGHAADWDRRVVIETAPAFAIVDEAVSLTLRVEDLGAAPAPSGMATLSITLDAGEPREFQVPLNQSVTLPLTLTRGGINTLRVATAAQPGELTDRNNSQVVSINGVRDRLRVLLVSGEPYPGERTWRNLLKSDSSVDLVHFTILRPPDKQEFVPVFELSLIAFPTQELFMEKVDEFDLIIFDRYKRRGILPASYFDNIRAYVEQGGALLIAAGPDFASAQSIYRSPLAPAIPGEPTSQVFETGFRPEITDLGRRHPVTQGLDGRTTAEEAADPADPAWGRWFRLIDVAPKPDTETVMQGVEGKPLLVLDRMGEGRVALLASDQAWLWTRGYDGGGPQLELLRRLAHWMMKEPELEEEALIAESDGQTLTVTRRTLGDSVGDFTVTAPDGTETMVTPEETAPGRFQTVLEGLPIGLYRVTEGDRTAVAVLGPAAPKEFEETIATGAVLAPVIDPTNGGVWKLSDGDVDLRTVREGRPAAGRGWLGITPRGAYQTASVTSRPLLPAWAYLLVAAGFMVGAWVWEGRRRA